MSGGKLETVDVETRVQLELHDEALYHRAGRPDLERWADEHIKAAVEQTFFDVRYSQLLQHAARWEAEARPRMVNHEPMRIIFSFGLNDCNSADDGGAGVRVTAVETLKNAQVRSDPLSVT